ncbi:MAG: hypothetical protein M1834_001129 [Cirrosporium novae-zelandiae]|nr:MAG: hypothetical protein M1834_001129 [Cirrosporium novae-zelandiae]
MNGNPTIFQLLLDKGANINSKNDLEQSSLTKAVNMEHEEPVRLLLDISDTELNVMDAEGWTPVTSAAYIDRGADILRLDSQDRTLLHCAAYGCGVDCLRSLVELCLQKEASFDLQSQDNQGRSVLFYAVFGGNAEMVKYLIMEHHFDVNTADKSGWRPMHWAARKGNLSVVEELLANNADPDIRETLQRMTPREIALLYGKGQLAHDLPRIAKRYGKELQESVIERSPGKTHGALCSSCFLDIVGKRFQCTVCGGGRGFDLCEICKATSDETHPGHAFREVPLQTGDSSDSEETPHR